MRPSRRETLIGALLAPVAAWIGWRGARAPARPAVVLRTERECGSKPADVKLLEVELWEADGLASYRVDVLSCAAMDFRPDGGSFRCEFEVDGRRFAEREIHFLDGRGAPLKAREVRVVLRPDDGLAEVWGVPT